MDPYAVRWGEHRPPPPPRDLVTPPTALTVAGAGVERLRHGSNTVLAGLAVVVRDRNWGTVPARVLRHEISGDRHRQRLEVDVRHTRGEVDFAWSGRFEITPGRLEARFDGEALADFHRNRIGWCLLHPLSLAGTEVAVRTVSGERISAEFPQRIAPHQPLLSISSLSYRADGTEVHIELEGEEFETEDQRNWTDPSYKTYSTPLDRPFPVLVRAGERLRQRVVIHMTGDGTDADPTPSRDSPETIKLGPARPAPRLGLSYPMTRALDPAERRLFTLAQPDFLHVELDAADPGWPALLRAAAGEASRLAGALEAAVVTPGIAELEPVLVALRALGDRVRAVSVFDALSHVSTGGLVARARAMLDGVRVGGGTRAHFAELNRATELPLDILDAVGYSITPQMHADDRGTVRDTLLAQPATVRDARVIAGRRSVQVGPLGFRARFNAVATGPEPPEPAGQLPAAVDPRQASVFGAAWTVGALAALAEADTVVLYDVVGRRGLMGRVDEPTHPGFPASPGRPFPVWQVLAALRATAAAGNGPGHLRVAPQRPGVAAVVLSHPPAECLLLANLRDEPVELAVEVPAELADRDGWLLAADETARWGWSTARLPASTRRRLPAPSVMILSTERIPVPDDLEAVRE